MVHIGYLSILTIDMGVDDIDRYIDALSECVEGFERVG